MGKNKKRDGSKGKPQGEILTSKANPSPDDLHSVSISDTTDLMAENVTHLAAENISDSGTESVSHSRGLYLGTMNEESDADADDTPASHSVALTIDYTKQDSECLEWMGDENTTSLSQSVPDTITRWSVKFQAEEEQVNNFTFTDNTEDESDEKKAQTETEGETDATHSVEIAVEPSNDLVHAEKEYREVTNTENQPMSDNHNDTFDKVQQDREDLDNVSESTGCAGNSEVSHNSNNTHFVESASEISGVSLIADREADDVVSIESLIKDSTSMQKNIEYNVIYKFTFDSERFRDDPLYQLYIQQYYPEFYDSSYFPDSAHSNRHDSVQGKDETVASVYQNPDGISEKGPSPFSFEKRTDAQDIDIDKIKKMIVAGGATIADKRQILENKLQQIFHRMLSAYRNKDKHQAVLQEQQKIVVRTLQGVPPAETFPRDAKIKTVHGSGSVRATSSRDASTEPKKQSISEYSGGNSSGNKYPQPPAAVAPANNLDSWKRSSTFKQITGTKILPSNPQDFATNNPFVVRPKATRKKPTLVQPSSTSSTQPNDQRPFSNAKRQNATSNKERAKGVAEPNSLSLLRNEGLVHFQLKKENFNKAQKPMGASGSQKLYVSKEMRDVYNETTRNEIFKEIHGYPNNAAAKTTPQAKKAANSERLVQRQAGSPSTGTKTSQRDTDASVVSQFVQSSKPPYRKAQPYSTQAVQNITGSKMGSGLQANSFSAASEGTAMYVGHDQVTQSLMRDRRATINDIDAFKTNRKVRAAHAPVTNTIPDNRSLSVTPQIHGWIRGDENTTTISTGNSKGNGIYPVQSSHLEAKSQPFIATTSKTPRHRLVKMPPNRFAFN